MARPGDIEIRGLYKVFGPDPEAAMDRVREGVGKEELLSGYDHILGLRHVDLAIEEHTVQVVMGLSGSGKSTLIRHINRLIEPTEGEVLVGGQDVLALDRLELQHFRRHEVSMVFQRFALLPHKTVLENVAYGLSMQGVPRAEWTDRAGGWIERVGLTGYEDSYPARLSGGMQQRVGLARALATDAGILLMDEPFSALDPLIRTDMQALLLELQRELHKTIVFVTHDLEEAIEIGDRIAILRDGEIVQNGDPQQIVLEPVDDYIAEFTRNINRGRVLRVGSLMEPAKEGLRGPPRIPAEMSLGDALPLLTPPAPSEAPVVDDSGETVGSISAGRVVAALGEGSGTESS